MLAIVSTLILVVIGLGVAFRKTPKIHLPLMATAFTADISLLLYVEWSRHAIETVGDALKTPGDSSLIFFHVTVSLLMIILYIAQLILGIQLFRGLKTDPKTHRTLGYAFLACRLANYATGFLVTSA